MEVTPGMAALTFVALGVLTASVWSWLVAAAKAALTKGWLPQPLAVCVEAFLKSAGLSPRLPLVPWNTRRPVPWGFSDLIILLGVWIVASLIVSAMLRVMGLPEGADEMERLSLQEREAVIAGNIAVAIFILSIGLPLIALRAGASAGDFGWSWRELATNLRLGLIGFVMLAPPVYAIQGLLVNFWQPSKHPLMEMFKGSPDAHFFAILFASAAVMAPLLEELIFRVVLQGFLEKAFSFRRPMQELVIGGGRKHGAWDCRLGTGEPPFSERLAPSPEPPAPPTDSEIIVADLAAEEPRPLTGVAAWFPIAISSTVFALLHYSHGPDWIPLLLLAAGMGYLYQRTHRLLPSLVVHSLLNSLSLWGLWVEVHGKGVSS